MGNLSDQILNGEPQTQEPQAPATPPVPQAPDNAPPSTALSQAIVTAGQDPEAKLHYIVGEGSKIPADTSARVLDLQMKTGLPVDLIQRNLDQVSQAAAQKDFNPQQFMATSPVVARWLSQNPVYASVAQHDLGKLSLTEALLKSASAKYNENTTFGERMWNDLKTAYYNTKKSLVGLQYGGAIAQGEQAQQTGQVIIGYEKGGLPVYAPQALVSQIAKQGEQAVKDLATGIAPIQAEINKIPQRPATLAVQNAKNWNEVLMGLKQDPLGVLADIGVTTTAQQLPVLALTVATRSPIVAAAAMGASNYATETGNGLIDYLAGKGVDTTNPQKIIAALNDPATAQEAMAYAHKRALIMGAVGLAGGGIASRELVPEGLIKSAVSRELTNAMVAQPIAQGVIGTAGTAATGDTSPGALFSNFAATFAYAPFEAATFGAKRYVAARPGREAAAQFKSIVQDAGTKFTPVDEIIQTANQAVAGVKQAADTAASMNALDHLARDTKMREAAPAQFEQLVKQVAGEGNVDSVYIPREKWDEYFQSAKMDPAEAAARYTDNPQAYTDAEVTGDVVVPLEKYAARIAGTDVHQGLAQDLRFNPEDMTLREAQDFKDNSPEWVQKFLQETVPDLNKDGAPTEDTSGAVYADALAKLTAAGMDKGSAEQQATLMQSVFRTLGSSTGADPLALYKRYGLTVERQLASGHTLSADQTPSDLKGKIGAFFQRLTGKPSSLWDERGQPILTAGERSEYTVDGKPVKANPDTPEGLAVKILAHPDQYSLDKVLAPYDAAGETDFANQVRQQVKDLQGRVGFNKEFFQEGVKNQEVSKDFRVLRRTNAFGEIENEIKQRNLKNNRWETATTLNSDAEVSSWFDSRGLKAPTAENYVWSAKDKKFIKTDEKTLFQGKVADQTQTEAFKKWFGDSKVVDSEGKPLVVYHGTTADFNSFDASKGNAEADFGKGFYFSNNPEDIEANYAGMGPDLTQKIELDAERIESESDGKLSMEEARKIAAQKYKAHEGATMPVYLKMEDPFVVGGPDDTFLDFEMPTDENGDYTGDESGRLVDFIVALRDDAEHFDDTDIESAIDKILQEAMDNGGINASDLMNILNNDEKYNYAVDPETGALASHELTREALQDSGFDGVIDHTVNQKFGSERKIGQQMQGMNEDTVHYIAFKPEQIKSAIGNRGTFDPNDPNILMQSVYHGSPHTFDKFSLDAIGTGEGAQAYGWGLYFAGKKEVAHWYKEQLSNDQQNTADDLLKVLKDSGVDTKGLLPIPFGHFADEYNYNKGDINASLKSARQMFRQYVSDGRHDAAEGIQRIIKSFEEAQAKGAEFPKVNKGNLYQADIPEDKELLDWDKPLNQQPENVQTALAKAGISVDKSKLAEFDNALADALSSDNNKTTLPDQPANPTGEEIYQKLVRQKGSDKAASDYLNSIGIPGLRYLDGASRTRPLRAVKRQFLAELPADADAEEVMSEIGKGVFSPENEAILKALEKDGWLGFDYPAQALSAALGGDLSRFDPSPELRKAVADAQQEGTHNYVIWDDSRVSIEAVNDELRQAQEMKQGAGPGEEARGKIQFNQERNRFNITLLEKADLTTFLHESGHFYLEVMNDLIKRGEAPDQLKADWQTIREFVGAKEGEDFTTDQHEQFARAFEAYLGEGKAPSLSLSTAFAHFKEWVLGIYKSLKNLNVNLTDEVRGVFDRLLATDDEIKAAEQMQNYTPTFESAEAAGMSKAQFKSYQDKIAEASAEAQAELAKEAMDEALRARQAWFRKRRADVKAQVTDEINQQPVYRAMYWLQKGELPDGSKPEDVPPLKLSRDALVEAYGEETLKKLPRPFVYTREGGLSPETVAPMFGFANGDELVGALMNAEPRTQAINAETDKRLNAEYGDLLTDGTIAQKALDAVHNDKRLAVMLAEQRALDNLTGRKRSPSTRQVVKASAKRLIGQKRIMDIKPNTYRVAEAKSARDAFEAAKKQDYNAASVAKSREMLNHELYREARAALDAADKTRAFLNSFTKTSRRQRLGKAGADYLEQMDALLNEYEFQKIPLKQLKRRESLAQFLRRHESDVQPVERPRYADDPAAALNASADPQSANLTDLQAEIKTTNWKQLTPDELQGVRDNAELIWHLAKLKDSLLASVRFKNLQDAATIVSESIRGKANRTVQQAIQSELKWNKLKQKTAEYLAQSRRVPTFAAEMDGGEAGGAMWEAYVRPLNEATNHYTGRLHKFGDEFAEIYNKHYTAKEQTQMLKRPQSYDAINTRLTKDAVLAMALNWGNETNRNRLMNGDKWSVEQVHSVLKTLDARDWSFVQSMWDYINTYWGDFAQNHKDLFGIPPVKVEGDIDPILREAMDKYGIELKGGYYPIVFDPQRSTVTSERALAQEGQRFMSPKNRTRAGAAIERVKGNVGIPLRLTVAGVVQAHISDVIHHIAYDKALLDTSRILHHPEVRDAIIEHYGKAVFDRFNRMLIDIKWGTEPAKNSFEQFLNHVRNGASVAGMAFSVTTSLLQPLGLSNSVAAIGADGVMKGLARMGRDATHLQNSAAWAMEQSEFMRYRRMGQSREIGDVLNRLRKRGWRTKMDVAAFWLIANSQFVSCDLPTWYGAYEKAKSAGQDHATAVQIADQMVRDAQGGGDLIDQTEFQRGGPVIKLFTNFMSYVAATYSLEAQRFRTTKLTDPIQVLHFVKDTLLLMAVPAVGQVALDAMRSGLTGGQQQNKTPLDWAQQVAWETGGMFAGPFIGVRDLLAAARGYNDTATPAGLAVFGKTAAFIAQLEQLEADEAFWRSLNAVSGVLFHLPAVQIDRTVRGAYALWTHQTDNPLVLLLGPPPKPHKKK